MPKTSTTTTPKTSTTTTTTTTTTTQRPTTTSTTTTTTSTTPIATTPTTTVTTTTPTPPPTTTMRLPNQISSTMKPIQPLNPLGPGIFTNLDTSLFETSGLLTTKPPVTLFPVDIIKHVGDPFTNLDSVNAFDHYSTKMNMHPTTPFNGGNEFPEKGISGFPGVPALPTVETEEDWPYTIPKLTTARPNLNPEDVMSKVVNQLENVPAPFIPLQTTRKPIIDDDLIVRKIAPIAEAVPKSLPGFGESSRLNIMTTQSSMLDVGLMKKDKGISMDTIPIPKNPDTIPRGFSAIPLPYPAGTTTLRPFIDGIIDHIAPTTVEPSIIDMINKGVIPNVIPSSILPPDQPTLQTLPFEVPFVPTIEGSKTKVIDKLNIISSDLDKGFKSVVSSVVDEYKKLSNPPTTTPKSFYGVVNTVVSTLNKTNHQTGIEGLIDHMKPQSNTVKIPHTDLPTLPAAIPTFPVIKNPDFAVPDLIPSTYSHISPFVTTPKYNNLIDSIQSAVSPDKPSIPLPSLPPTLIEPILPAMSTARPSIPNIPIPSIPPILDESIQHYLPSTTVSTLVNMGRDVVSNIDALGAGVNTNFLNLSTGSHGHPVGPVPTMVSMSPVSNDNNVQELNHSTQFTTGQTLTHVPSTSGASHNVNLPSIPTNPNHGVVVSVNLEHNINSPAVPTLSNLHSTIQPREASPHLMTHNFNPLNTPTLPTYKPPSLTTHYSQNYNVSMVPTQVNPGDPDLQPSVQSSTIAPQSLNNIASPLPAISDNTLNIPPLINPSLPTIPSSQPPALLTIISPLEPDFHLQPRAFEEAPIRNNDFHSLSPPVSVPPRNAVTPQSEPITLQTASPKPVNPDLDKAIGMFENSLNDLMKEMEDIGLKQASDVSKNSKSMPSRRTPFGQKVELPKDKFDQSLDGGLNQLRHDVANLQLVSQNDEQSRDRINGVQNDGPKQEVDNIKLDPQHGGPDTMVESKKNETKPSDGNIKFDPKSNVYNWEIRMVLPDDFTHDLPDEDSDDVEPRQDNDDVEPRQDEANLREDNEFMRDQKYHPTPVADIHHSRVFLIPDNLFEDPINQTGSKTITTTSVTKSRNSVPGSVTTVVLILCLLLTGVCFVRHRRRRKNEPGVVDESARREERLEENTRETGPLERSTQIQESSFCRFVNPHSMQLLTELKESQYQSPPTPQPIYEEIRW
uniref:Uncharacterized protein n=2 Tax=Cacopsylla melanoneura TaxID=428564 RepID=A0A8D9AAX8_9HEMI